MIANYSSDSSSSIGYTKPWAFPVSTDLPNERALLAAFDALAFQTACLWFLLLFDFFFLGTAIVNFISDI